MLKITNEDISSLNDNEINSKVLLEIKNEAKNNIELFRKIRQIKKVSYLTRNIMNAYKNRLMIDVTKEVISNYLSSSTKTPFSLR